MGFYIKKVIFTELTEQMESGYSMGLSFSDGLGIQVHEGDDDFFERIEAKLYADGHKDSSWSKKPHILTIVGSNFRLSDSETLELANDYLKEEYGELEAVDEGLDYYSKVYLHGKREGG